MFAKGEYSSAPYQRMMLTEGRLTRVEKKLDEAQEKILALTTRSMRDNLVIKNVDKKKRESEEQITFNSMFKDRLKLTDEDLQLVQIERAYQVGKPRKLGSRPRNIVAKLSSKGKSTIMSKSSSLSVRVIMTSGSQNSFLLKCMLVGTNCGLSSSKQSKQDNKQNLTWTTN